MKAIVLFVCLLFCNLSFGDTIRLTNGNVIHGKVEECKTDSKKYVVKFVSGFMLVKKSEVESIVVDDKDDFVK